MNNRFRFWLLRSLGIAAVAGAFFAPGVARAADSDVDGTDDEVDALPCDPRAVSVAYAPGKDQQGTLLFEDLWPAKGDLDFNDVGLTYNYIFLLDGTGKVSSMQVSINVVSVGSALSNRVALHLPVPASAAAKIQKNFATGGIVDVAPATGETDLVIPLVDDVLALYGNAGFVNTTTTAPSQPATALNLYVKFAQPVAIDLSAAPFDLYIERTYEAGHQVHRPEYAGTATMNQALFGTADDGSTPARHFVDKDGLPFALVVPQLVVWPQETVSIEQVYPKITSFAASSGAMGADWYMSPVMASAWTGGANGTPAPTPVLLGPKDPTEDVGCSPWHGAVQFGVAPYTWAYESSTDATGNVFVSGFDSGNGPEQAFVTKYGKNGQQGWTAHLASTNFAVGFGSATDAAGDVFVSGYFNGTMNGVTSSSNSAYDAFVAKLDPNGDPLWVRSLGQTGYWAYSYGVATAADGSVYATAITGADFGSNPSHYSRATLVKYDKDGNPQWVRQYQPGGSLYSEALDVTVDASGNPIVSGNAYSSGSYGWTHYVMKLDASGNEVWEHFVNDASYDWGWSVATDAAGNVFSSGYRQSAYACNSSYCYYTYDAPLWKLDSSGNAVWMTAVEPTTANNWAQALGVATDASGNAFFSGMTYGAGGQTPLGGVDYFVAKADPSGNLSWVREGGSSNDDWSYGLCTDSSGGAFVVGTTNGDVTGTGGNTSHAYQAFIVKYDESGTKQ